MVNQLNKSIATRFVLLFFNLMTINSDEKSLHIIITGFISLLIKPNPFHEILLIYLKYRSFHREYLRKLDTNR